MSHTKVQEALERLMSSYYGITARKDPIDSDFSTVAASNQALALLNAKGIFDHMNQEISNRSDLVDAVLKGQEKTTRRDELEVMVFRQLKRNFSKSCKLNWDDSLPSLSKRKPDQQLTLQFVNPSQEITPENPHLSRQAVDGLFFQESALKEELKLQLQELEYGGEELSPLTTNTQSQERENHYLIIPDKKKKANNHPSGIRLSNACLLALIENKETREFLTSALTYRQLLEAMDSQISKKIKANIIHVYREIGPSLLGTNKKISTRVPISATRNREAINYFLDRLSTVVRANNVIYDQLSPIRSWIESELKAKKEQPKENSELKQ